jgi:hypothetical protein
MASRKKLKLRELCSILRSFGVTEERSRGKGGHVMFIKIVNGKRASYPVPCDKEVLDCYVQGARRKFGLTVADGVTDAEFYSRS